MAVADSLRRIGGGGAVIARVGGEEFLVAETIGTEEALLTAQAIRLAIAATPWSVTASLGVSSIRLTSGNENLDEFALALRSCSPSAVVGWSLSTFRSTRNAKAVSPG